MLPLMLALSLMGCGTGEARIEGRVVDIWGSPIEGATVMVEGGRERPLTDASGRYAVARMEGAHTIKAGRQGFIQEHQTITIDAEAREVSGPTFTLYPEPERFGLHLVLADRYTSIEPARVYAVGTPLQSYRGIRSKGDAVSSGPRPRVLWHTDLPLEDIVRLDLELRRLRYLGDAELTAGMGRREVPINLFVDDGPVHTEFTPLRSKYDYLVAPTEPLEPGTYAFQTQGLLSGPDPSTWSELPPELRTVHAFTVP